MFTIAIWYYYSNTRNFYGRYFTEFVLATLPQNWKLNWGKYRTVLFRISITVLL